MRKYLMQVFFIAAIFLAVYLFFFGPTGSSKELQVFVVPKNQTGFEVIYELKQKGLIKNIQVFELLFSISFKNKKIKPGGYRLSQSMNSWEVFNKIMRNPDLVWITFGGCLRKEQIGEIIGSALGWNDEDLYKWNTIYTNSKPEYIEGVYYPDTYLIPVNESGEEVAGRLINQFNQKFAPLSAKFIQQNIRWTTGLKIASLIAREAAGADDMRLISGIIWNRLDIGMPLQIDATMQYTLGKNINGNWWGEIDLQEKQNDSLYNSYLYKGLPPTPICSPNIDYIEAVLYPEETSCLFYLHDRNKKIHCAETYEDHLENIEIYLN